MRSEIQRPLQYWSGKELPWVEITCTVAAFERKALPEGQGFDVSELISQAIFESMISVVSECAWMRVREVGRLSARRRR
jgi:hypothetical protein